MANVAERPAARRGGRGARRETRSAISDEMLPALRRRVPLIDPALDPGIDQALQEYIARREREIPAEDALNNLH